MFERIQGDMERLASVGHRFAGSEGERRMLHEVRGRLGDEAQSRIEGFVGYTSPHIVVGLHAAALLLGGLAGIEWPLVATLICSLATLSLVSEAQGRFSVLRRLLPKAASYNLVLHHSGPEEARGTVVLSAPLDAPRWRPNRPWWLERPLRPVVGAAVVVTTILLLRSMAEPWGRPTQAMYLASLLVLGAAVFLGALTHRAGGSDDDASGCVALLELRRRLLADAAPGLEIWTVFTGCAHAYQNGMHAFLAVHGVRMVGPVLVLALDDPGRPPFAAVRTEGPLLREEHRPTGPAMIERLRWNGLDIPEVDCPEPTDARAALRWGYRALALSGADATADVQTIVQAVDVAEAVIRMYAEDVARITAEPTVRVPDEAP